MTVVLVVLALGCAASAAWLVLTDLVVGRSQRAALSRLSGYGRVAVAAPVRTGRRGPDIVGPLSRVALRITPGLDRARIAAQLQAAGFSRSSVDTFLALKVGLTSAMIALALLFGLGSGKLPNAVLLGVAGGVVAFRLPDLLLRRHASARREKVLRALPNALDLLAVVVEAGLGLDAALQRYADRADGPLAQEIAQLVAELRVGSSRASVFRSLAERVPALETQSFVRAITTADQLGVSLSRTLRIQARDARVRRQMVAEQRANKTPVKILFPTVLCIFPALFIVVLAPAVLSLLHL